MKNQFKILCGTVAMALAGQVSAATDWTLNTGSAVGNNSAVTATSSGWANTVNGSGTNLEIQPAGTNLRLYTGGLGINNLDGCSSGTSCDVGDIASDAPEHAIDNNQRYEMVLLSFTQNVQLTNTKFGWTGTDSDFTVLAYTGAANGQGLAGKTWDTLGSGWTKIGNYNNATTNTNVAINAGNVSSSYWLIGAYNPLAGGDSGWTNGNDYLKLASVSGTIQTNGKVPEPDSLALFGIALLGLLTLRKRQQA